MKGDNEVEEAQRIPRRINQRKNKVRHVIIKLTKKREKEKKY